MDNDATLLENYFVQISNEDIPGILLHQNPCYNLSCDVLPVNMDFH